MSLRGGRTYEKSYLASVQRPSRLEAIKPNPNELRRDQEGMNAGKTSSGMIEITEKLLKIFGDITERGNTNLTRLTVLKEAVWRPWAAAPVRHLGGESCRLGQPWLAAAGFRCPGGTQLGLGL